MISDDIRDEVPYAKEVRDLARLAHRLLREKAREPPGGHLRDFRSLLRRIDLLRRQLARERRSDLLRWLERLGYQVEMIRSTAGRGRRPLKGRQESPAGSGTSWVLLDAELGEGSSHESCLA